MSAETRHDEAMVRQALATLARSSQADGLSDRDADDMRRAAYVATQAMDRVVTRLRAAEARTADLRAGLERVVKRCAEGGDQALAEAQCALDWDDALPAAPEAP